MASCESVYLQSDDIWEPQYCESRNPSVSTLYGSCCDTIHPDGRRNTQESGKRNLAAYCDSWLEVQSSRVKISSLEAYRRILEKYVKPRFGTVYPEEMNREALEDFKRELLEEEKLSPARVQTILIVLRSVLEYAREHSCQICEVARVVCPGTPPKPTRVLTRAELDRLITCLRLDFNECKFGILIAICTGLKVGELCALRWADVSILSRSIDVTRTLQRVPLPEGGTRMMVTQLTGAQARTIPLTEQAVDLCLLMNHSNPCAYLMTGNRRFMEPRLAQMRLKKYVTCCGLEGVTFRTLRDTFTRNCVEAGLGPGALCAILGYTSVASIPRDLLMSPVECVPTDVELLESAGF